MDGLVMNLLHTYFRNREESGIGYECIRAQIRALYGDFSGDNAPVWFCRCLGHGGVGMRSVIDP